MFDRSQCEPKRVVRSTLRAIVRDLDPSALSPDDAIGLVGWFAEVERLAAAGKALCAKRVADSGRWREAGERSPADWLAKKTGASVGDARGALDTAANIPPGSATDSALRGGELSPRQAEAIASATKADPAAEQQLLDAAKTKPLAKLRDECARVKAATTDMEARQQELHRNRKLRTWTNELGARCGYFELTPDAGAELERLLKPFADAVFERARRAGRQESSEAYAADGLLDMARASERSPSDSFVRTGADATSATGATETTGPDASVASAPRRSRRGRRRGEGVVLVNLESLHRGHVEGDETCEIPGVGPVSVAVARDLLGDALLRLVITDGVDIRTVLHAGRLASDVQRTAIEVRQRGRCLRPTCHRAIAQIDHTLGFPITGATTLDDLGGLCHHDHDLKTLGGHTYRYGTHGWEWHLPDGTVEYERPPPPASERS